MDSMVLETCSKEEGLSHLVLLFLVVFWLCGDERSENEWDGEIKKNKKTHILLVIEIRAGRNERECYRQKKRRVEKHSYYTPFFPSVGIVANRVEREEQ